MNAIGKLLALSTMVAGIALGAAVAPASAHWPGYPWRGFPPRHYYPRPVFIYPPPAVYVEPPPVCRDVFIPGYWRQVAVTDPGGFTTYRNEWVPGSYRRVCQ